MTRLTLTNLCKRYPGSPANAVDDLNLIIPSGGLHALLGPSGCGKTTTMKMIAGLLQPSSGDIRFDEDSVRRVPAEKRGAVMVFQKNLLFPYMSVGDNVAFGLKMRGVDRATISRRVAEMLALVRLPGVAERRPNQLSGGQQQRVALARALIIEPKLLLLDEPLSNLDAHLRDEMRELIRGIQRKLNITTVFVTHDQAEAVVLADQIALMFDGVLQQNDTPDKFYEEPASEKVARFFGGTNFVPGTVREGLFHSEIGSFQAPRGRVCQGTATLSIRPELVELGVPAGGENTVTGRILTQLYVGTHTRYDVAVGEQTLQVVAQPQTIHRFSAGDEVTLRLPPEHIWLLEPAP